MTRALALLIALLLSSPVGAAEICLDGTQLTFPEGDIETEFNDGYTRITADGNTYWFTSSRPGGRTMAMLQNEDQSAFCLYLNGDVVEGNLCDDIEVGSCESTSTTAGSCSPVINGASGDIIMNYDDSSCN